MRAVRSAGARQVLLVLLLLGCRSTPSTSGAPAEAPSTSAEASSTRAATGDIDAFDALDALVVGEGDGPVVILLHGYGARSDDLVPLVQTLQVRPGMRFVFPAGPFRLGGGALGWWPLPPRHAREAALASGGRDLANETPEGLVAARTKMVALLRECRTRFGVTSQQIVIGGFSQGAMLAIDAALHADEPPGVVLSFSGALVSEQEWLGRMPLLGSTRVFVSHGRQDTLLPFSGSERLVRDLADHGVNATFVPFDGDHELPHEVLMRARAELEATLPGPEATPERERAPASAPASASVPASAVMTAMGVDR